MWFIISKKLSTSTCSYHKNSPLFSTSSTPASALPPPSVSNPTSAVLLRWAGPGGPPSGKSGCLNEVCHILSFFTHCLFMFWQFFMLHVTHHLIKSPQKWQTCCFQWWTVVPNFGSFATRHFGGTKWEPHGTSHPTKNHHQRPWTRCVPGWPGPAPPPSPVQQQRPKQQQSKHIQNNHANTLHFDGFKVSFVGLGGVLSVKYPLQRGWLPKRQCKK